MIVLAISKEDRCNLGFHQLNSENIVDGQILTNNSYTRLNVELSWSCGLTISASLCGEVYDYRPLLHRGHHFSSDQSRRRLSRNQGLYGASRDENRFGKFLYAYRSNNYIHILALFHKEFHFCCNKLLGHNFRVATSTSAIFLNDNLKKFSAK